MTNNTPAKTWTTPTLQAVAMNKTAGGDIDLFSENQFTNPDFQLPS